MVKKEDLNKRPSDLEIAKKDLPENTPTLGERLDRDVYNMFHVQDEKQGYRSHRKPGMSLQQEVYNREVDWMPYFSKSGEAADWAWHQNTSLAGFQGELSGANSQILGQYKSPDYLKVVREEIKKFDKEVRDTVKAPHANISDWWVQVLTNLIQSWVNVDVFQN